MMMPCTGPSAVVNGMRIAMAGVGPMPGIIPASEPISTPMSAIKRLAGVSAFAKPPSSMSSEFMFMPPFVRK